MEDGSPPRFPVSILQFPVSAFPRSFRHSPHILSFVLAFLKSALLCFQLFTGFGRIIFNIFAHLPLEPNS
jgi:hypothetical protein